MKKTRPSRVHIRGLEQVRVQQSEDFKLVMGALADQRDSLREGMRELLARLDSTYAVLEQRLETYQRTSLELIDKVADRQNRKHRGVRRELDEIRERLDRLEESA